MRRIGWWALVPALSACSPKGEDGWVVGLYGYVVDEARTPVEGAALSFSSTDPSTGALVAVGDVTTDADGRWDLPVFGTELLGNVLEASIVADGLAPGVATWEVNLRAPETNTLEAGPWETWQTTDRRLATVRLADDAEAGVVQGVLRDAVTGDPVPGATLQLQQGWNAPIGAIAATSTVTDDAGTFQFSVYPAGAYTVLGAAAGAYGQTRFPVFLSGNTTAAVGLVTTPPGVGLLRASITWGSGISDLDLHLSAPRADGTAGPDQNGRYHIWSGSPQQPVDPPPDVAVEAALERSDADGTGPETVAIYSPPGAGDIGLWVYDNDHGGTSGDDLPDSDAMANAGVVMQVWFGEDVPRFYEIDPNEVATAWNPVQIDDEALVQYAVEQYASGGVASDPDAF